MSSSTRSRARVTAKAPALRAMETAIRDFLVAAGLEPDEHRDLRETPRLVAQAWANDFLNGYRASPRQILAKRMMLSVSQGNDLVVLTPLTYQSVCPHHLLPYGGFAHIAYLPHRQVVGYGQIVQLLDCLSHRLVLQEELAHQLADTLVTELNAKAAGVILEGRQSCLNLRGGRRHQAKTVVEAWSGAMIDDGELRQRFFWAIRGEGSR